MKNILLQKSLKIASYEILSTLSNEFRNSINNDTYLKDYNKFGAYSSAYEFTNKIRFKWNYYNNGFKSWRFNIRVKGF